MLFAISNAFKKRAVLLFQDILRKHPIFSDVEVYTRFPEVERPKYAVLIRNVNVGSQKLALDNFIATDRSYCTLANLKGVPGDSIEWVKDDVRNIDKMSPPGFYVYRVTGHKENSNEFEYYIDPYLIVYEEKLNIQFIKNTDGAILANVPINPNSLVIYSQSHEFDFKPEIDYTVDLISGEVLFKTDVKQYEPICAEYEFLGSVQGPFTTEYYRYDNKNLPGVITAWGDRIHVGDTQVVFVDKEQNSASHIFGGRWDISTSLQIIAQDSDQSERLADFIITSLWSLQTRLTNEGIHVHDFNISESEDSELELPEEWNFIAQIDFISEVDWEISTPLIQVLRRVSYAYGLESYKDKLTNEDQSSFETSEYDPRMKNSNHHAGLQIVASLNPAVFPGPFPRVQSRKY